MTCWYENVWSLHKIHHTVCHQCVTDTARQCDWSALFVSDMFTEMFKEHFDFLLLAETFLSPWSLNWKELRSLLEFMFFQTIMTRSGEIYSTSHLKSAVYTLLSNFLTESESLTAVVITVVLCNLCSGIGLCIQSLENDGRAHRDGRLHVGDRITEVNGTSLVGVDFTRSLLSLLSFFAAISG